MYEKFLMWLAAKCVGLAKAKRMRDACKLEVGVVPKAYEEKWISSDGTKLNIGDMEPTHVKHALALVMRRLRAGEVAYVSKSDRIAFAPAMYDLIDGEIAFEVKETGTINSTNRSKWTGSKWGTRK